MPIHVQILVFDSCCNTLSDDDCESLASGMTEDEDPEDEEMELAAQHLNQEFNSQVLEQGDQGGMKDQEGSRDTVPLSSPASHVPMTALLGPLPSAASLGLTDSIRECITEEDTTNGKCATSSVQYDVVFGQTKHSLLQHCIFAVLCDKLWPCTVDAQHSAFPFFSNDGIFSDKIKVQGSRFFIICHIHNHTGYNR